MAAAGDVDGALLEAQAWLAEVEAAIGPNAVEVAVGLDVQVALLRRQVLLREAKGLAERSLAIREMAFGTDHLELAPSLNNLAVLMEELGDPAASRPYFERSLAIQERTLGPDHPDMATSLFNFAGVLVALGDYAAARVCFERCLAIREQALGPDHLAVAASLHELGDLLFAQGDYAAAKPLYLRGLEIRERQLGQDHPEVARSLSGLGGLLLAQGDHAAARPLFERSLAIFEASLGPDHPDVALSLNNLAVLLEAVGDYAGARPLHLRSLAIREKALGPDHPHVAISLDNLALLLKKQGDYAAARPLYERSLVIWEKALGPDHPDVALTLSNLAMLLATQGDYAAAQPLSERSLAIWQQALGPEHPTVAKGLNNLGGLLERQGDYAAARRSYEESLAILTRVLGPDHPDVAQGLNNLAVLLAMQGDFAAAQPLYERSLSIREHTLGPNHPAVAISLHNLALSMKREGDYVAARPAFERSLAIHEVALGPAHPHVATSLHSLAGLLAAQRDYAAAAPLYERSLSIREKALGPDHPDVASSLNDLALLLQAQGDFAAAQPLFERSITIWEKALGQDHPQVAQGLDNLAALLRAQDDHAAARPLLARSLMIVEGRLDLLDGLSQREALRYLAESRPSFDSWLSAFDQPGDAEQAWSTVLHWKGVVSRRMALRRLAAFEDPSVASLANELATVRRERSALTFAPERPQTRVARTARLQWLGPEQERLERALAEQSASWSVAQAREELRPADLCGALPDGARLVDVVYYRRDGVPNYVAFVLDEGCRVTRVELGAASVIDDAVHAWRVVLTSALSGETRVDRRGDVVRSLVWDPLAPALAGATRVVLVPDGALSAIPYGALPVGDRRYLLEDVAIDLLADARDVVPTAHPVVTSGVLAVGGVDFQGVGRTGGTGCAEGPFEALPGTVREVDALQERWSRGRFRGEPVRVVSGMDATEDAVFSSMEGRRVVHLATHGFYASDQCQSALGNEDGVGYDPFVLSGLVFAQGDGDWVMTAADVSATDLRGTQLVVLSACESGLGATQVGEGVQGLRKAFSEAGAQSTVMSLWRLPDDAAAELTDGMYARVLARRGAVGAADALRTVQVERLTANRERYGDARLYEWAGLVVSGL